MPSVITQLIQEYTFNISIFKIQWFNRMIQTNSMLDKGYKLVPIYNIILGGCQKQYYCIECYMESFVKKTTYINNIECNVCDRFCKLQNYIGNKPNIILPGVNTLNFKYISYEILSYKEMINREELSSMYYLYGYNISTLLKSSKLISEFAFLDKKTNYKTKFHKSGLQYALMIPSYWNIKKTLKWQYILF